MSKYNDYSHDSRNRSELVGGSRQRTKGGKKLHDKRHSFASRALALGESLPTIGRLLGHGQVATTARYAHLARDAVKASASRVADSIAGDIRPRAPRREGGEE